ncbi:MAG: hypothetical protein LBK95_02010 [Bifidobacteriaceae bacterium]|nr:hypothetical protein [Bifidobacteriaceae bacterium]
MRVLCVLFVLDLLGVLDSPIRAGDAAPPARTALLGLVNPCRNGTASGPSPDRAAQGVQA